MACTSRPKPEAKKPLQERRSSTPAARTASAPQQGGGSPPFVSEIVEAGEARFSFQPTWSPSRKFSAR